LLAVDVVTMIHAVHVKLEEMAMSRVVILIAVKLAFHHGTCKQNFHTHIVVIMATYHYRIVLIIFIFSVIGVSCCICILFRNKIRYHCEHYCGIKDTSAGRGAFQ